MRRTRRWQVFAAGLLVLGALVVARAMAPAPFLALRAYGFDSYQALHPYPATDAPVLVLDIDDRSLAAFGQWPWPRTVLARLLDTLADHQAAAVALDILLSEPDRSSPARLAQDPALAGVLADGAELPDYDTILAEAVARSRVVMAYTLVARDAGTAPPRQPVGWSMLGAPPGPLLSLPAVVTALPALQAAALGNGAITHRGDAGGIVRRMPLVVALARPDGEPVLLPSLAVEALRVAQGANSLALRGRETQPGHPPVLDMRVGRLQVPLTPDGHIWLHHGLRPPDRTLSVADLLNPEDPDRIGALIRGRIIFVGTSAAGLADLRATPLNPLEPGVNLHARAAEQILDQAFLHRPAWATGAELVSALALAVIVTALVSWVGPGWAALAALVMIGSALVGGLEAFARHRLLLDPVPLILFVGLSLFVSGCLRFLVTERERRRVRDAFAHYVSPDLVAQLTRNPDSLKLGGEEREMTFLFTDLAGFTSLTESTPPEVLVGLLNRYLDGICGIVMAHGGTVDKIVGDAVVAMFNAPLTYPDHAARAVRCALAIDRFAEAFRKAENQRGLPLGHTRIGVNTGSAVVGNFGGAHRFDYTAHGDAINTAARLEAANKELGTRICVSGQTKDQCPDISFTPRGTLVLRGKTEPTPVFEPQA